MRCPDYRHGLVSLSNSILRGFGVRPMHETLPELDVVLDKGFQNVVLMLFDGMGMDALERHLPETGFLRRHLFETISSVFPPTTTAATASLLSGLTPCEHGWLGWSLYFREIDKIVDLYPNTVKDSGGVPAAEYHVASRALPYEDIGRRINAAGYGKMVGIAPFEGLQYRVAKHDALFETVRTVCDQPGKKFVYAYWNQPDDIMHRAGCRGEQAKEMIGRINRSVETLCGALHDTLLLVVADHGHIDTRYAFICDYPDIMRTLERPFAIESRAAAFYVKEKDKSQFVEEFTKAFGESFILLSREEVLARGLFGAGTRHPRFTEWIGDYLAVATGDVALAYGREARQFASNHAGITAQEMDVPLILVEKPE